LTVPWMTPVVLCVWAAAIMAINNSASTMASARSLVMRSLLRIQTVFQVSGHEVPFARTATREESVLKRLFGGPCDAPVYTRLQARKAHNPVTNGDALK